MIEIISILGGAVARLLTWGAEYYTKKQENTHELALLDKQLELQKAQSDLRIAELKEQRESAVEISWGEALNTALAATSRTTGNSWIDTLNGVVRPVLTLYWCIVLYTGYKLCLVYAAVKEAMGPKQLADVIATDFDRAVVGSIFGYWFADRSIRKFAGK